MSITKQKGCFARKTGPIASFRAIIKQKEDYSNPIVRWSGIVQQLFSETDTSEKSL
jgi:hypothetical protein